MTRIAYYKSINRPIIHISFMIPRVLENKTNCTHRLWSWITEYDLEWENGKIIHSHMIITKLILSEIISCTCFEYKANPTKNETEQDAFKVFMMKLNIYYSINLCFL